MVSMLNRLHFTLTLCLQTDMHIGTGEREKLSVLLGKVPPNDKDADPEVALTARGQKRIPIIPATALKSALRRVLTDSRTAEAWFGAVKQDGSGNAGCVWLGTAYWKGAPADCAELPYWNSGARQTFIATHVAIDRATRTADDQKLYNVERVPAGTTFEFSGDILAPQNEAVEILKKLLEMVQAGISVGADERHGAGRLTLASEIVIAHAHYFHAKTAKLEMAAINVPLPAKEASKRDQDHIEVVLKCAGPYVSLDVANQVGNARAAARRNAQSPTLSPASLLGALRSRCAWLSWSRPGCMPGDDPFRAAVKRDAIATLTCTERLFGVNGWRGLVRITRQDLVGTPADRAYTSVALDRFTQGPLDDALFTTDYFHGCGLTFAMALDQRGAFPTPADTALFEALLDDVKCNGLMLGHGTNKGFGWFSPMPASDAAATVPTTAPVQSRLVLDPKTGKMVSLGTPSTSTHKKKKRRHGR